jgi:hypothetical protein
MQVTNCETVHVRHGDKLWDRASEPGWQIVRHGKRQIVRQGEGDTVTNCEKRQVRHGDILWDTVYDRLFGDFAAKVTVYAIRTSVPYICTVYV